MCKIFKSIGLGNAIEANKKTINFLDTTLNLTTATYKPFNKPGNTPIYIHHNSNHPHLLLETFLNPSTKDYQCSHLIKRPSIGKHISIRVP